MPVFPDPLAGGLVNDADGVDSAKGYKDAIVTDGRYGIAVRPFPAYLADFLIVLYRVKMFDGTPFPDPVPCLLYTSDAADE